MLLIGSPKRRRGIGALVIAVVLVAMAGAATARLTTDGVPVSCQVCYDNYPTWWCVWVWGCPDPGDAGGGGGSGAQSTTTRPVR